MASSRCTYTAEETARHILEGDGSKLDRIDVDLEIEVCLQIVYVLYIELNNYGYTEKCVMVTILHALSIAI